MENSFPPVQPLPATALASPAQAGPKAFHLGQLALQGHRVPPFFCVPAAAHRQYAGLPGKQKAAFQAQLQQTLAAYAAQHLPGVPLFSVRSSALVEDGETASFAGQFKTTLRVAPQGLGEAVVACWHTGAAAAYKERTDTQGAALFMGVIIQQMVEADLSGVAFSANPQGLLNEAVVVCGTGTGNNVVEDRVPTTTYYHNLHDGQFYYERQPGAGLLAPDVLRQLVETVKTLGATAPVDVEYAVKDNQLWLLQQRPITALKTRAPIVLDNSNIVESYGGLCLPLTISFAKFVYTQVFTGLARRCLPKRLLGQYTALLGQMVNSANGRMYYQISNWYTVLKFLPLQQKIIPVWQRMMGVQTTQYDAGENPVPLWAKIVIRCKILAAAVGIPKKMKALEQDFDAALALFKAGFHPGMEPQKLEELFGQLAQIVLRNWDITLLNDLYAFVFTGLYERQFRKAGAEPDNRYLAGNKNMESMKPVREAWALAQKLRADEALKNRLAGLNTHSETLAYLASGDAMARDIQRYLDAYGDRSFEELKLETQTFRSSPLDFIHLLLAYAEGSAPQPRAAAPPGKPPALQGIGFWRRRLIGWAGKKARLGIANRETSRLNRGRIFGMVRALFTEMGEALARAGIIKQPRDVFYLSMEELFAYNRHKEKGTAAPERIRQRKADYAGFATLPAYARLVFAKEVFNKHPRLAQGGGQRIGGFPLRGTACSEGVAQGEALVVTKPVSAQAARGKILVASTTDPGWVFLLAVAKGVVAEKGSLLSHTAIISRELGIPSVVGVDNATELLKTGDSIRIDGGAGIVEKCSD